VRAATGFAIGGVSPVGLAGEPALLFDADLLRFGTIWPAAGSPNHVFSTTPAELLRLTGAQTADTKEDSPP
jgi:prolyl-tRNA editing enzyme YbaK/EbsC (Cys-tRNA(Pro) deacylase)